MTDTYFVEYTGLEVQHFRDTLLQHLGIVKNFVAERTRHQRQYERRVNKRQMQTQESKIDTGKALDVDLVDTESIRTDSTMQDDSSRSGNDTDVDDADIRPIYDEEPMAEVQLMLDCNNLCYRDIAVWQLKSLMKMKLGKLTPRRDRNSKNRCDALLLRISTTADGSKQTRMSPYHKSRRLPVSKSSRVTITAVPKADTLRVLVLFSDSNTFLFYMSISVSLMQIHDIAWITKTREGINSRVD
ncbi:hypothetical protein Tco_1163877 [Tanacetum coccineum]